MNKNIDISNVTLHTERLLLRPFYESDLDDLFEYASVDGVGQMAGWLPHKSKEVSRQILNLFIAEKKTFAVSYHGKVIGSVGIERYDENEFPEFADKMGREIGYVLSKDYWGMGLMPEAVHEIVRWLFEEENLDFILCGHFVKNQQSQRVQEKCGFVHYKRNQYQTQSGTTEENWVSIRKKSIPIKDETVCSLTREVSNCERNGKDMEQSFSAAQALERLLAGNRQFLNSNIRQNPGDVSPEIRRQTARNGQHPYAIILACSDSRELPEAIFCAGIGELFVIRVAGNVVDRHQLGSIEYAAEHLGCPLALVLGHDRCGAVDAALHHEVTGDVKTITDEIRLAVGQETDPDAACRRNVRYSVEKIRARMAALGIPLQVIGGLYHLESGSVELLDE